MLQIAVENSTQVCLFSPSLLATSVLYSNQHCKVALQQWLAPAQLANLEFALKDTMGTDDCEGIYLRNWLENVLWAIQGQHFCINDTASPRSWYLQPQTPDRGRDRTERILQVEEQILERVEEEPDISTRRLAAEVGVSQFVVHRTLKEQGHIHTMFKKCKVWSPLIVHVV